MLRKGNVQLTWRKYAVALLLGSLILISMWRWTHWSGFWTNNHPHKRTSILMTTGNTAQLDHIWTSLAMAIDDVPGISLLLEEPSNGVTSSIMSSDMERLEISKRVTWVEEHRLHPTNFSTDTRRLSVVIATSCKEDLERKSLFFEAMFANSTTHLYCVIHDASDFDRGSRPYERLKPWIYSQRIRIIALSEGISQNLRQHWGHTALIVPISVFLPVFKVPNEVLGQSDDNVVTRVPEYIAILPHKFNAVVAEPEIASLPEESFSNFSQALDEARRERRRTAKAVIFGADIHQNSGNNFDGILDRRQDVPKDVHFYRALARVSVIVGVDSEEDSDETVTSQQTSAAVSAAIIAGVPIVMSKEMENSYPDLPLDAYTPIRTGENAMQAAFRQLSYPPNSQTRLRGNIARLRTNIVFQNREKMMTWLSNDMHFLY